MDWKTIIKEETEDCGITLLPSAIKKGDQYRYVISPFESRISKEFQQAVLIALERLLKKELKEANCIVLSEAKSFLLAPLALKTGKDIVLIRKKDYKVPGEIVIKQETTLSKKSKPDIFYCVGLDRDDKPILLDDLISSGRTTNGVLKALIENDIKPVAVASVYERGQGVAKIKEETGFDVKSVARLEINNEEPECIIHEF